MRGVSEIRGYLIGVLIRESYYWGSVRAPIFS